MVAAAVAVPLAGAVGAGGWWTARQPPVEASSALEGERFAVRLTPDPATGTTRVSRGITALGSGTPLAVLPSVDVESPHLGSVVLPGGTPSATSLRLMVVHHPELVWADLHDAGTTSFVTDATQTFAAAEHRVAGGNSSEVVWGDLGGRVHGMGVNLWAPFPGRRGWVVYLSASALVARSSIRGVAQPAQNSQRLTCWPLDVDAELPVSAFDLHLADGSQVLGIVWDQPPGTPRGEERVEWELGGAPMSAPERGGARFWHLPEARETFPELELQVDGTRRRFSVLR